MSVLVNYHLFTVEQYYKMAEVGILRPSDRVELINGEIIQISPIKSTHASIVDTLAENLIGDLRGKAIIRVQNPLSIDNHSEPEPDLLVAKLQKNKYRSRHPQPKDVLLLIEVSDSTLEKDRKMKLELYAKAKIAEYWIVNIPEKQIEIYRKPSGKKYKEKSIFRKKEIAKCSTIDFKINVKELF